MSYPLNLDLGIHVHVMCLLFKSVYPPTIICTTTWFKTTGNSALMNLDVLIYYVLVYKYVSGG